MTLTTTLHVNFDGQAADALAFYAEVFGGTVTAVPYGETAEEPEQREQIVWGEMIAPSGVHVMAYDIQRSLPHDRGVNPFYLALRGHDADEVRAAWEGLSQEAEILAPFGPSAFSPLYGKLVDRFGVVWIIDVIAPWNG